MTYVNCQYFVARLFFIIILCCYRCGEEKNWTREGKERSMVSMVDSFTSHDRPPPPITKPRLDDLPEIEIPSPPGAAEGAVKANFKLPPTRSRRRTTSTHELLLPRRRKRFRAKVLLFSVIGFGIGILVGVGFLLG